MSDDHFTVAVADGDGDDVGSIGDGSDASALSLRDCLVCAIVSIKRAEHG